MLRLPSSSKTGTGVLIQKLLNSQLSDSFLEKLKEVTQLLLDLRQDLTTRELGDQSQLCGAQTLDIPLLIQDRKNKLSGTTESLW
jgi:hypothetical protein